RQSQHLHVPRRVYLLPRNLKTTRDYSSGGCRGEPLPSAMLRASPTDPVAPISENPAHQGRLTPFYTCFHIIPDADPFGNPPMHDSLFMLAGPGWGVSRVRPRLLRITPHVSVVIVPGVHIQRLPGDGRGEVRGEEHDRVRDLLGRGDAAQCHHLR